MRLPGALLSWAHLGYSHIISPGKLRSFVKLGRLRMHDRGSVLIAGLASAFCLLLRLTPLALKARPALTVQAFAVIIVLGRFVISWLAD